MEIYHAEQAVKWICTSWVIYLDVTPYKCAPQSCLITFTRVIHFLTWTFFLPGSNPWSKHIWSWFHSSRNFYPGSFCYYESVPSFSDIMPDGIISCLCWQFLRCIRTPWELLCRTIMRLHGPQPYKPRLIQNWLCCITLYGLLAKQSQFNCRAKLSSSTVRSNFWVGHKEGELDLCMKTIFCTMPSLHIHTP